MIEVDVIPNTLNWLFDNFSEISFRQEHDDECVVVNIGGRSKENSSKKFSTKIMVYPFLYRSPMLDDLLTTQLQYLVKYGESEG